MARDLPNIKPLVVDDLTEEDQRNFDDFVSLALKGVGAKESSHKNLLLDSHQKTVEEQRDWIDGLRRELGGELCVSCWNPEENSLSWNSGMFHLYDYMLPEDVPDEENDSSLVLYKGGDLTCTTNRLPASTRNHFYKVANESVRMQSRFQCLHELYGNDRNRNSGVQLVLNHAKPCGNIWVGVIQVVSDDLLRCLRNYAAMNNVIDSYVLNTSRGVMNTIQTEVGRFFELTQMNACCGVINSGDLDDYDMEEDDDSNDNGGDEENQSPFMVARNSSEDSWICGIRRLDFLDNFYLNQIRKMYDCNFPQAVDAVLSLAQKRFKFVDYILEEKSSFTARIPILCYQRALFILLEIVEPMLAARNSTCFVNYQLLEYEEENKWQIHQPSYQDQPHPKHILRTQVAFYPSKRQKLLGTCTSRQKFAKLLEVLRGKFVAKGGLMLFDMPLL